MPFFIHSGAGALFQRWTIALLITCWKCLYCRPQPLIVAGKWLSFSRCVHAHILSAHPDTICLFYPTAALRVIMPGRTTALFVRQNEIRGEETTGEARQQGTDAIQWHPFVTANCCAVGSGSQGEALLLMWTMFMKDAQVPVALERLKFFLLDGVLFLQCSPKAQVQSTYICSTWPGRALCEAASVHLPHEESAILLTLAHSFTFWHALLYSRSVSHRCPSLSSKRRRPREAYQVQTHRPLESTWRRYLGRVALQGWRSRSKLWGRT